MQNVIVTIQDKMADVNVLFMITYCGKKFLRWREEQNYQQDFPI